MYKFFLKTLSVFLILFIAQSFNKPQIIFADGLLIDRDPYSDRWDYSDETNQQAFINYEEGLEKMIISIGINQTNNDLYWIFPVPSNPEKVSVDVVNTIPSFNGEDINLKAQKNLQDTKNILRYSQVYPFLFENMFGVSTLGLDNSIKAPGFGGISNRIDFSGGQKDVIVYGHLDKEGITSEIITAKTPLGLTEYFEGKGFKFEVQSVKTLSQYFGNDFTFVISWITNNTSKTNIRNNTSTPSYTVKQKKINQKGIFVTFPTKNLYYPLIPTSIYGKNVIPTSIRIIGHVSPEIFDDVKNYTDIKYFVDSNFTFDKNLQYFFKNSVNEVPYTLIEMNAPSNLLSNDLWISRATPLKIFLPLFIFKHPHISTIILLVISSFITGTFTGWLIIKEARNLKGSIKYGVIGLANCLTIIGLIITTLLIRNRKIVFIPIFSINFLIISWILIKIVERAL